MFVNSISGVLMVMSHEHYSILGSIFGFLYEAIWVFVDSISGVS